MLRADYDSHALWDTLRAVDDLLDQVLEDHEPTELPFVERIRVQVAYLRSFDVVASTRVAFFHPDMLNRVNNAWAAVSSGLSNRVSSGVGSISYLATAADASEAALNEMGAWPRQYGKGGEVTQMNTLFEGLLEAQRQSIDALTQRHADLLAQVEEFGTQVEAKRTETTGRLDEVNAELARLEGKIEADAATVQATVATSEEAVADLTAEYRQGFEDWKLERAADFKKDFESFRQEVSDLLDSSRAEYEQLLAAKESYQKLVSAIAADEVASRFEAEAQWGRRAGVALYILGFVLLVGAALPLLMLLGSQPGSDSTGVNWNVLVVRIAIGVLAGSAAAVAIRLGSRLINGGSAVKRMELELRAIGPFLANVAERDKIDDARIELVNRAFGKAYTEGSGAKSKSEETSAKDDAIPVSALSQVVDIVQRLTRNP